MNYYFNGRYVSEGEPAGSGRSAVLRALRRSDKSPVVVKIWEKDAPEGKREAEIWRSAFPDYYLESRNEGSRFVLVRRWINGVSLEEYMEKAGALEQGKAVSVCLCVALRLRRFYQMTGMYFGDLRPANIILGENSVFFIDFESAGEEINGNNGKSIFKSKTLRFITPGFAAPEVFRGRPCCASDFYALGVLLAFLMTGEASPSAKGIPKGAAADFIGKCTAENIGDRFASIEACAASLAGILRELGGRPFGTLEDEVLFFIGEDIAFRQDADEEGPAEASAIRREDLLNDLGETFLEPREEAQPASDENAEIPGKGENECEFLLGNHEYENAEDGDSTANDLYGFEKAFGGADIPEPENVFLMDEEDRSFGSDEASFAPQDAAILFPHYEKGYRRLILYVPGNTSFSAELGYVFGTCFGLKTCVFEFCDYSKPRLPYYFSAGGEETGFDDEPEFGDISEEGTLFAGGRMFASETGPSYGDDNAEDHREGFPQAEKASPQYFAGDFAPDDFSISSVQTKENRRVSFGAGTFGNNKNVSDDFMRCFMSGAYTDYDVTVICDNMTESRENSVQLMRYSDYLIVTVNDEADELEAAVSRYTRLLAENHISCGRLKLVCWEKDPSGADEALFRGLGGKYEYSGSISYDPERHGLKNNSGEIYCGKMSNKILREYCGIVSKLTFGERNCA
ncbi:MAG: hypothetical protein J6112_04140 [Clostridia bacterium]|nr:hypothetical protein [Clostridia bacterium]